MSAPAPAKFRFDLDLGHREERNSVLTESALSALLSKARAEGHREGLAEGEQVAAARAAERLAHAAEQLADHVAAISAALDDHRQATVAEAVELAAAIARKLAGSLVAAQPLAEIDALIADCLASLHAVPHLVIRCAPELADAVRETAHARIATSGFSGRLVVLGDPDQAPGDARLEWADGGIARDRAALEAEIDRRIQSFIASRLAPVSPSRSEGTPT
ncbi:MAG TPA: FliH/SctL family protein [Devosia sp.]|nr:FliH/SctL family protein [Devosia sp.]